MSATISLIAAVLAHLAVNSIPIPAKAHTPVPSASFGRKQDLNYLPMSFISPVSSVNMVTRATRIG